MKNWHLEYASGTKKGLAKPSNQDAIFAADMDGAGLFAVCDGMGGHSRGEMASNMIVEGLDSWWTKYCDSKNGMDGLTASLDGTFNIKLLKERLENLIYQVNMDILNISRNRDEISGSTAAILFIEEGDYILLSVGDSRIYSVSSNKTATMLTRDHSWVFEQVESGKMTESEAEEHPFHNKLTQAIGGNDELLPFVLAGKLRKNDCFIICSDGLYKSAPTSEWFKEAEKFAAGDFAASAMAIAERHLAEDDVSVVVVKCESDVQKRDSFIKRLFSKWF